MDSKKNFIGAALESEVSMTALCQEFGISRKTGYKWLSRFKAGGEAGLVERSRAAVSRPNALKPSIEARLVELRKKYPRWGARKIRKVLGNREPRLILPSASTITAAFHRNDLIGEQKRQRHMERGPLAPLVAAKSNDTWSADFKGHFYTGDGEIIRPFTLSDAHSRFLLSLKTVPSESVPPVKVAMERCFKEFGLPDRIRSDNGCPFGSWGLYGLTRLVVWLIKLGIQPERIEPGKPGQNARHERFHETLKLETAMPPAQNRREQQKRFREFKSRYNEQRPHESLDMRTPSEVYSPSSRPFPLRIEPLTYPSHFMLRKVRDDGGIYLGATEIHITEALSGETVALEPISEDRWVLHFGSCRLAHIHQTNARGQKLLPLPYRVAWNRQTPSAELRPRLAIISTLALPFES